MLTPLEQRILGFIRGFIARQGYGPTLLEIGTAMGIQSKGTVHRYVQALRDKGHLARTERGWRGIRLARPPSHATTLPLAGRIAAGRPIEAIPQQEEIDLGAMFLGENRYALQVRGDSMIGVGILDGDTIIVERSDTANDGDIVVALVDTEETTLKRLRRLANGEIELIPENPSMSPMRYTADRVCIQGVLVGQLRQYG